MFTVPRTEEAKFRWGLILAVGIGWLFQLAFSVASQSSIPQATKAFAILWFVSGAAFFIGAIAGFLFGVPRARRLSPTASAPEPVYTDNTNLEDVSDWLTKIIVGLGLVQFGEFTAFLGAMGDAVGSSIATDNAAAKVVALASILYGFVCAFIFFYVWTRVWLPAVLVRRVNTNDTIGARAPKAP